MSTEYGERHYARLLLSCHESLSLFSQDYIEPLVGPLSGPTIKHCLELVQTVFPHFIFLVASLWVAGTCDFDKLVLELSPQSIFDCGLVLSGGC